MAITVFKNVYVVEMTDVNNGEITTFPIAYLTVEDAESFVLLCKATDKDLNLSGLRTYQVKRFTYYR